MNLQSKNSEIKNNIFNGSYWITVAPVDPDLKDFWISKGLNPTGITGVLVKYSSPDYITLGFFSSSFNYKISKIGENIYNALLGIVEPDFLTSYLPDFYYDSNGNKIYPSPPEFAYSGYIYYSISTSIIGACHGFGNDKNVWYSGYNFYNAFHPQGYIAPPFGESFSVYLKGDYGYKALDLNCHNSLTSQEYNDLIGIVSETNKDIDDSVDTDLTLQTSSESFINSPAIACPQDLSVAFYFREKQYSLIAGSAAAISANTHFNTNPIPSSLDMFNVKTKLRYKGSSSQDGTFTVNYQNDQPVPQYKNNRLGNNPLSSNYCYGISTEGILSKASVNIESFILDSPDILGAPSKSKFEFFTWWNSWHFLFKENSDGFPFQNDFKLYSKGGGGDDYIGVAKTPISTNYGSQLFQSFLSDPDHYWENRQCPGIIDFLPHTFGASIYACPSYHFDVPYYAALNKFGFYGARFLTSCVKLNLTESNASGVKNSLELPYTGYSYNIKEGMDPVEDTLTTININSKYDTLLKIANKEEKNNDFYNSNKLFFLYTNYNIISGSSEFSYLTGKYSFINDLIYSYTEEIDSFFKTGSGEENLFKDVSFNRDFLRRPSVEENEIIFTGSDPTIFLNKKYSSLSKEIKNSVSFLDFKAWEKIEKEFLNVVLSSSGIVNTGFYDEFIKSKNKRFLGRYIENYIAGNPIDLYPSNKIGFNYDRAKDFIESYSWGKSTGIFSTTSTFEDTGLNRRYFLGTYSDYSSFQGYLDYIKSVDSQISTGAFYPGYFNSFFGTEFEETQSYKKSIKPVITGNSFGPDDIGYLNLNLDKNEIKNSRNNLGKGWYAFGYGGGVNLDKSYTCFTPIFVQQPINLVHCKIGQSPTFRCLAVDYHTIPEDKINDRYPEIMYWAEKLKIVNDKKKNKYPLTYKWFRIKKSDCNNNFNNFIASGYFSNDVQSLFHDETGAYPLEPSSPSGNWCCLEGNDPSCTLIHPKECDPVFTKKSSSWSNKYEGTPGYEEAKRNNFYMSFKKGAIKNVDDQYYYFCMTKGRFGVRISEPSELFIDNVLKFDISIQNGGNYNIGDKISISFDTRTGKVIEINDDYNEEVPLFAGIKKSVASYEGFLNDPDCIPENVIQQKIPPPNRGWGDVYSYKFVGTWGYRGALQTFTPGTLDDTRGLLGTWGRFLNYGSLKTFTKVLSQEDGDAIYGIPHLPSCISGDIVDRKYGLFVKINLDEEGKFIYNWTTNQNPIVSTDGRFGVIWNKLGNAGELYIPSSFTSNAVINAVTPGLGQWQWGNNLGSIHKFGYKTPNYFLQTYPGRLNDKQINKLKEKLLIYSPDGKECGYNPQGLGRNMLYWIEGFSSFYLICDPLKKKNVTNYNYMNPGLRHTNSSIQYFWLGKPSNCYLKRRPMFGPYAYQWKVMPHNRDRNGNGMSEGFYSYGWATNYSLMYDAPAIYGLFRKYKQSDRNYINEMNRIRSEVFSPTGQRAVRYTRFGFTKGNGGARRYGNVWIGVITGTGSVDSIGLPLPSGEVLARDYVKSGEFLAKNPEFDLYGCSDKDLENGNCFDPCLSIRYPFGFLPGGKFQSLAVAEPANGAAYNLVANNIHTGKDFEKKTVYLSGAPFRGPFGTPHHKFLEKTGLSLNGFSPCRDGGADHCNYMTPTINLGSSSFISTESSPVPLAVETANSAVDYPLPDGI